MALKRSVLILGYGEMGHAMQMLLEPAHEVYIWNRSCVDGRVFPSLESLLPKANIIIFALPINAHNALLQTILPLKPDALCISIAKGLDELGDTAAEIFKKQIKNYALIYGPMIAEELSNNKAGFAQFGCSHEVHQNTVTELFKSTPLCLRATDDIVGISWSAILKNVYALAFGMSDELNMGKNVQGFLMVMAMGELDAISKSFGAPKGSSYGLAGLGDLTTTGSSEDSRHHTLGRNIARGDFSDMKSEGTHTLLMVTKFKRFNWNNYPLFEMIEKIVSQQISAKEGLSLLFKIS